MGKQKLTSDIVKLIKHMKFNVGMNHCQITKTFGFCSRPHVIKITQNQRWGDVETPSMDEGESGLLNMEEVSSAYLSRTPCSFSFKSAMTFFK